VGGAGYGAPDARLCFSASIASDMCRHYDLKDKETTYDTCPYKTGTYVVDALLVQVSPTREPIRPHRADTHPRYPPAICRLYRLYRLYCLYRLNHRQVPRS
jgi:hypothetical protein